MILTKPDIVIEVRKYTELKKRGKYFWGLCPLHTEKTPSFKVDPDPGRQTFYCFGCHAHGDVIAFIMKREGLSFKEVISRLGINGKPHKPDTRELKKYELVRAFRQWCNDYHSDLCLLFRTLQKAKERIKTEADLERLAKFYHQETEWLCQIEILQDSDDDKKLKLYGEYINGFI